ncbi:MAG: hypothetical protein ABII74_03350, partial [Elusimicrobiota bacterium]
MEYLDKVSQTYQLNLAERFPQLGRLIKLFNLEGKINFNQVKIDRDQFVNELTKQITPEELKNLVEKSDAFRKNKIGAFSYYSYLTELAQKTGGENFLAAFPNFASYITYSELVEKLDYNFLFEEMDTFSEEIPEKLAVNQAQTDLIRFSRKIDLLEKLVLHQLNKKEWAYYQSNKPEFTSRKLQKFLSGHSLNISAIEELDSCLPALESFYQAASQRDDQLTANTLSAMAGEKVNFGVLITGGFHTQGIIKRLRNQGISYLVIAPKIGNDEKSQAIYDARLRGKHITDQEIQKDFHTTLAPPLALTGTDRQVQELYRAAMTGGPVRIAPTRKEVITPQKEKKTTGTKETPGVFTFLNNSESLKIARGNSVVLTNWFTDFLIKTKNFLLNDFIGQSDLTKTTLLGLAGVVLLTVGSAPFWAVGVCLAISGISLIRLIKQIEPLSFLSSFTKPFTQFFKADQASGWMNSLIPKDRKTTGKILLALGVGIVLLSFLPAAAPLFNFEVFLPLLKPLLPVLAPIQTIISNIPVIGPLLIGFIGLVSTFKAAEIALWIIYQGSARVFSQRQKQVGGMTVTTDYLGFRRIEPSKKINRQAGIKGWVNWEKADREKEIENISAQMPFFAEKIRELFKQKPIEQLAYKDLALTNFADKNERSKILYKDVSWSQPHIKMWDLIRGLSGPLHLFQP